MRNLLSFRDHKIQEAKNTSRRDFLTGVVTTFTMLPITGWGVYKIIKSLFDDYSDVDDDSQSASGMSLSEPGRKFLDGVYKSDPGYKSRITEVENMLGRVFADEDVELTQKMYDAIVMTGVRVGARELSRSAFLANVKAGEMEEAAEAHQWLEGGALKGDALEKAVEFERDLFLSRRKMKPVSDDQVTAGNGADILRGALDELGYQEKGREISSGGPINPGLAKAVSAILRQYKQDMPDVEVVVTAGNDLFHKKFSRTQHKVGRAIDLVIRPYNRENADAFMEIMDDYKAQDPKFKYVDEYRYPSAVATGGHFHLQYKP
jgi:hypothetical protein